MSIQWTTPKPRFNADAYVAIELLEGKTEEDVIGFFEALQKGELEERIVKEDEINKNFKVDNVFRISRSIVDVANETMSQWASRKTQYQWITIAEIVTAVGGLGVCRYSNRWYLIVASFVGGVAVLCFGGAAYAIYCEADHESHIWTNTADEFLQRRDKALNSTFPQIFTNACRFGLNPKKGTLTDLEVLVLWKIHFQSYADKALASKPKNAEQEKEWLVSFIESNPFSATFFKDDPQVLDTEGWEPVKNFQTKVSAPQLTYAEACQTLQEAKDVLLDGKAAPDGNNANNLAAPLNVAPAVVDEEDSIEFYSGEEDDFKTPDASLEEVDSDSDDSGYESCESPA